VATGGDDAEPGHRDPFHRARAPARLPPERFGLRGGGVDAVRVACFAPRADFVGAAPLASAPFARRSPFACFSGLPFAFRACLPARARPGATAAGCADFAATRGFASRSATSRAT